MSDSRRHGGSGGSAFYRSWSGGTKRPHPENELSMVRSEVPKALVHQALAPGTAGTAIQLAGNFYKLATVPTVVYHYDVTISKSARELKTPAKDKELSSKKDSESKNDESENLDQTESDGFKRFLVKFSQHIMDSFASSNSKIFSSTPYVFDGQKSLYTTKRLPIHGAETFNKVKVNFEGGKPGYFDIKMKRVDRVDLQEVADFYLKKRDRISERAVSIYEIVLRFISGQQFESYQRKFFDMDDSQKSPKVPIADFVNGFISSVRLTEFGLALNLHLKTTCIISRSYTTLPELVHQLVRVRDLERDRLQANQLRDVNRILRHVKIFTSHTRSKIVYTIDQMILKTPQEMTFNYKGREISIANYFKDIYGETLKRLPMIQTSGKRRYLPLELCYLVDKQFLAQSKIDSNVQRELLFKSTHSPNVYFDKLDHVVKKLGEVNPKLQKAFGITSISRKPVQFTGRVLPAPKTVEGRRGGFYKPGSVPTKWGIFVFTDRDVDDRDLDRLAMEMQRFAKNLSNAARQMGLDFSGHPHPISPVALSSIGSIKLVFGNLIKKSNNELIFVGIPGRHSVVPPSLIYNLTKHHCDQLLGITSCCFHADKVLARQPPGYFDNFLLKVNTKLGGANCIIEPAAFQQAVPFDLRKAMVMAVDVNHPGATEKVLSSISAAVGSYDANLSKYSASIKVQQKERDEMVQQLDEMVLELLSEYKRHNSDQYPDYVFCFRDGVSSAQFEQVRTIEISLIEEAFKKIGKLIKLTVVIVQKRHHTRFVRTEAVPSGRKMTYNVPNGTVVDQCIVEPTYRSFYLNSHFSPLGTSKPTKYIVVRDDLQLSSDQMQSFCYFACHNCARTKKVIAIPTSVRYADLAAYRSKLHIEAQRELVGQFDAETAKKEEEAMIAKLNDWVKIHKKVKNRLYYC